MDLKIRAAWIGVAGTLLGTVVGAALQPLLAERIAGPREGLFRIEQECFDEASVPEGIRSQVRSFPCAVRIAHVEGPAAVGIRMRLIGAGSMDSVIISPTGDSLAKARLVGGQSVEVEVAKLVKRAAYRVGFRTSSPSTVRYEVQYESGNELRASDTPTESSFFERYETPLVMAWIVLSFLCAAALLLAFLGSSSLAANKGLLARLAGLAIALSVLEWVPMLGGAIGTFLALATLAAVSSADLKPRQRQGETEGGKL